MAKFCQFSKIRFYTACLVTDLEGKKAKTLHYPKCLKWVRLAILFALEEGILRKRKLLHLKIIHHNDILIYSNYQQSVTMIKKGQIALFAGNFVPEGWVLCNGENGAPNLPEFVLNSYGETLPYLMATSDRDDYLLGMILPVALKIVPRGWLPCEGQMLSVSSNTVLFSLLMGKYGGDFRHEFGLPKIDVGRSENGSENGENTIKYMLCVSGSYPMRS